MTGAAPKTLLQKLSSALLAMLTFLLPLKFGSIAAVPEATSYFPADWTHYLVIAWPAVSFGIFSGTALLLTLLAYRDRILCRSCITDMLLWCFVLPLAALPGFVHASCLDFGILEMSHILGISAWAGAVWIYGCTGEKNSLLTALVWGTVVLFIAGMDQYFIGFRETRDFIMAQEAAGMELAPEMRARTFDTRVFATFSSCNSLAGFLLLMLPVTAAVFFRWGDRFRPEKTSRIVLSAAAGGALLILLLLTKSRGAFLTLAAGAAAALFFLPTRRRWKWVFALLILLSVIAGAWYIRYFGRGFSSMAARLDYLRSSLLLWREYPLAGCGWGEFFFGHMRIKLIDSAEAAHDPHNIFMTAAQSGIFMVLTVTAMIFYPLAERIRQARHKYDFAVNAGTAAGAILLVIHSCMDSNFQVPAVMAALAVLFFSRPAAEHPQTEPGKWKRRLITAGFIALGLASAGLNMKMLAGEMAFDRLQTVCRPPQAGHPAANEIINAMNEALRFRPYSSFVCSAGADGLLRLGMFDEAESWYRKALLTAPRRAPLYQRLAMIYAFRGDGKTAGEYMRKAHMLFPKNPDYRAETSFFRSFQKR